MNIYIYILNLFNFPLLCPQRETSLYGNLILKKGVIPAELLLWQKDSVALLRNELARVRVIVDSVQCKLCIKSVSFVLEHTWIDKYKSVYLNKKKKTPQSIWCLINQSIEFIIVQTCVRCHFKSLLCHCIIVMWIILTVVEYWWIIGERENPDLLLVRCCSSPEMAHQKEQQHRHALSRDQPVECCCGTGRPCPPLAAS